MLLQEIPPVTDTTVGDEPRDEAPILQHARQQEPQEERISDLFRIRLIPIVLLGGALLDDFEALFPYLEPRCDPPKTCQRELSLAELRDTRERLQGPLVPGSRIGPGELF